MDRPSTYQALALRVSVCTILMNGVLTLFKLLAGILGHSGAMLSDAVHSASDVFSTLVVIAGVKLAGRSADRSHPYGHERMEDVAAILLSVFLAATGLGIGWAGIRKIFTRDYGTLAVPGLLPLVAALLSIAVKEWMFWYTRAAAKRTASGALMADAWHHRSDALSSVGAFIGILGARLGAPMMDPIASVVICIFIVRSACTIFRDGLDQMVDHSCDATTEQAMRGVILGVPGVQGIDDLKTRLFATRIYVDLEISADGSLTLEQSHRIAEQVHAAIERCFPDCKHCMVHVNPAPQEEPL